MYFCFVLPMLKASMGRGGVDLHIGKRRFVRFGFDELESRKFIDKSRTKHKERLMRCIIYVLIVFSRFFDCCHEYLLYVYIGVGLSALLVLTCRAMREPQFVNRVTEETPRLNLFQFSITLIIN